MIRHVLQAYAAAARITRCLAAICIATIGAAAIGSRDAAIPALSDPSPLAHPIPPSLAVARVHGRTDDRGEYEAPVGPVRSHRLLLVLVRPITSQRLHHEERDGHRPYGGAGLRRTDHELASQPLERALHPNGAAGEVNSP